MPRDAAPPYVLCPLPPVRPSVLHARISSRKLDLSSAESEELLFKRPNCGTDERGRPTDGAFEEGKFVLGCVSLSSCLIGFVQSIINNCFSPRNFRANQRHSLKNTRLGRAETALNWRNLAVPWLSPPRTGPPPRWRPSSTSSHAPQRG